jgi:hypothetical protein
VARTPARLEFGTQRHALSGIALPEFSTMPASTLTTAACTLPSPATLAAAARTLWDDLDDLAGFL